MTIFYQTSRGSICMLTSLASDVVLTVLASFLSILAYFDFGIIVVVFGDVYIFIFGLQTQM